MEAPLLPDAGKGAQKSPCSCRNASFATSLVLLSVLLFGCAAWSLLPTTSIQSDEFISASGAISALRDNFFDRAHQISLHHHGQLDNTMLRKPSHLAIPDRARLIGDDSRSSRPLSSPLATPLRSSTVLRPAPSHLDGDMEEIEGLDMRESEMPPPPSPGDTMNVSDDKVSEAGHDDVTGISELPYGVKKEIITSAPVANWKKPKQGDDVTVHYVGKLEADGSEFDSSRSRKDPFKFTVGRGQVIKGWDLGVATMKKGEVAKFTMDPEYAYGAQGSPPKIPPSAKLVFEIEMIGWTSKDDLFNDEGVIKTLMTEGSGWKNPKLQDEVLMSVKVEKNPDKTVADERNDLEYVIGSDVLGPMKKACDKALIGMKRGEVTQLTCSKDYSYGDESPEGVIATLTLKEIYEKKDVSFTKNKAVMKKQINHVDGYEKPKDMCKVKLSVESATDGNFTLKAFSPKLLEFTAGDGEVCDALECAVQQMKKGEKCVLTVSQPSMIAEAQLGLQDVNVDKVVLRMELQDFEKNKESWDMTDEEKIEYCNSRKEMGGNLFKNGRILMALGRYEKVTECFNYVDGIKDDENKKKAKELRKACELNKAACFIKLREFVQAKKSCDVVLKDESNNMKALFRHAQAEVGMSNFQDCINECKRMLEIEPDNTAAKILLREASVGQKEEDKKFKSLFSNMCKGLGRGPEVEEEYDEEKPKNLIEEEKEDDHLKEIKEINSGNKTAGG